MKKNLFKEIFTVSLISLFFAQAFYIFIAEPAVAIAATAPDNVIVTLNVDSGVSITDGANVNMTPNMGMSANGSIGSSSWTVKTSTATGYTLAVKASSAPALVSGTSFFADYTEVTNGTPEVWSVASGAKEFGYSVYGTDTGATWGTGNGCGSAGVPLGTMKYVGFEIADKIIASSSVVTSIAGTTTNICFAVEQDTVFAPSGTYTATITATATTL